MRSKYSLQKQKPVQLSRDGLPRFSWYVLSAPQADVKSALMKLLMKPLAIWLSCKSRSKPLVIAIRLNEQTTLV
jgi:hypothetical protein